MMFGGMTAARRGPWLDDVNAMMAQANGGGAMAPVNSSPLAPQPLTPTASGETPLSAAPRAAMSPPVAGGMFGRSSAAATIAQPQGAPTQSDTSAPSPHLLPTGLLMPVAQPPMPTGGQPQKHGFDWRQFAGILGAELMSSAGNPAGQVMLSSIMRQKEQVQQNAADQQQRQAQYDQQMNMRNAELRAKAAQPDIFTAGNDRVAYDPVTGKSSVLYHAASPFEEYATAQGLQPGSPEYAKALQDYVLRGNGPTAYGYDVGLENTRQQNRVGLEGVRQGDRLQLRNTPTYSDTHPHSSGGGHTSRGGGGGSLAATVAPILAKVAGGQPLAPGEQQAIDLYYHRGGKGRGAGGGGGSVNGGHVAVDAHGNKVQWNGSAWVPVH